MLSLAARRLALASRGSVSMRLATRPASSAALGKAKATRMEDFKPLEPAEWFPEFEDAGVRTQLLKLREMENDLMATVSMNSEPVDWAHWEKTIKSPGLVQELKEIHENLAIPDIAAEKEKLAKNVKEVFDPIIAEFTKLAKESEDETAKLEARAAEVTYLRDNIRDLTVEEFLEKYPTVKASIEDDIANNRWFLKE